MPNKRKYEKVNERREQTQEWFSRLTLRRLEDGELPDQRDAERATEWLSRGVHPTTLAEIISGWPARADPNGGQSSNNNNSSSSSASSSNNTNSNGASDSTNNPNSGAAATGSTSGPSGPTGL